MRLWVAVVGVTFSLSGQAFARQTPAPAAKPSTNFDVSPSRVTLGPEEKQQFSSKDDKGMPFPCEWTTSPTKVDGMTVEVEPGTSSILTITTPKAGGVTADKKSFVAYTGTVKISCKANDVTKSAVLTLTHPSDEGPEAGADITSAITGFEQAGASSANSDQEFFFDFFISRPLPGINWSHANTFGPALRWWGDVRIASYPQQVNSTISQFATDFGNQVGNLKVNEVGRFGEFRAGIDLRVASLAKAFPSNGDKQRSMLSIVAYYGALGAFHPPTGAALFASSSTSSLIQNLVPVYKIPTGDTPQAKAFQNAYPASKYPALSSAGAQYVAFTFPDRNQFYRQYGAGLRLMTRFYDENGNLLPAPAMVTASFGQHELVSGGKLRGVVGNFEGFYPYRLKTPALTVYLFGRANLRLAHAVESQPIVLERAKNASGQQDVPISDPGVVIIAEPSRRDMYTIGVGMDFASLLGKWFNKGSN
jgi:hypothetical protein